MFDLTAIPALKTEAFAVVTRKTRVNVAGMEETDTNPVE